MNRTADSIKPIKRKSILIEPPSRFWNIRLDELWAYRELLFFLVWRDIKVRYKQTLLGATWAIIQPVTTMIIFSLVFGKFAKVETGDIPYPIFTYAALLPWQLFSKAMTESAMSLVSNGQFITKIYFPRLYIPTASVLSGVVDFFLSFIILIGMMIYYQVTVSWKLLLLPILIIITILVSLSVSLWLSPINVKFRDVRFLLPFLVQVWLYATPIAYPISVVPENWRFYYALNPMVSLIESYRWVILGTEISNTSSILISAILFALILISGLWYFQKTEMTFADNI